MTTSTSAINALKSEEGFEAKAYADGETNGIQQYSIGYGHQIRPSESSLKTAQITEQKATDLLMMDIKPLEAQLNASKRKLNQNMFDSLISFGYDTGSGSLAKVLLTWNDTGSVTSVQAEMNQYVFTTKNGNKVKDADLVARRLSETTLFGKPAIPVIGSAIAVIGLAAYLFLK